MPPPRRFLGGPNRALQKVGVVISETQEASGLLESRGRFLAELCQTDTPVAPGTPRGPGAGYGIRRSGIHIAQKADVAMRTFGISPRRFQLVFRLAEFIQAKDASFDAEVLTVDLETEVPEAKEASGRVLPGCSSSLNSRKRSSKA
jgi:hypothetical protein